MLLKFLSKEKVKILIFVAIIFIIYQFRLFSKIANFTPMTNVDNPKIINGIHRKQALFYQPDANNMFTCITSFEKIDFNRINDDYCDCLDGSDEPKTNACPNGVFFCSNQHERFPKSVPSNRVNDGICDCCDGSDEWKNVISPIKLKSMLFFQFLLGYYTNIIMIIMLTIILFTGHIQKLLTRYQSPCPNLC